MLKGIDVSTLQGVIDWSRVSADFAMIKATQGRGEGAATRLLSRFTDSKFKRNIENCPVPCGAYHYFTGTTLKKTYEEADYFISVLAPYKSSVKLWAALDVESFYLDGLSAEDLTRFVTAALDRIRDAGYVPMLYTNPNYLKYRFLPHAFDAYDIWLAHWGVKTPYTVPRLKIWQYGAGSCPGVKTKVDLDIGYFEQLDTTYSVGGKYTIKAGDRYTNGVAVPSALWGKQYTIQAVKPNAILPKEILSWVEV